MWIRAALNESFNAELIYIRAFLHCDIRTFTEANDLSTKLEIFTVTVVII